MFSTSAEAQKGSWAKRLLVLGLLLQSVISHPVADGQNNDGKSEEPVKKLKIPDVGLNDAIEKKFGDSGYLTKYTLNQFISNVEIGAQDLKKETGLSLITADDNVLSNFEATENAGALQKRDGEPPLGFHFTQTRVLRWGQWTTTWHPLDCVKYNGLSDRDLEVKSCYHWESRWRGSKGFDVGLAILFTIKQGIEVEKEWSVDECLTKWVPAGSVGQTWGQEVMIWQDQQSRRCVRHLFTGLECGPWGEVVHGDIPVKNGNIKGWSTGYDNVDSSRCHGTDFNATATE